MPNIIGYARVSTADQNTAIQVDRLRAAGCGIICEEKASGASREGRSELANILKLIHAGDTLVVAKLDRLGRSTRDVLNIVHELEEKGAHLRVLEPEISTSGPMGKMILTVLGMVAEMERGFIKDRQRAGIDKAKEAGIYKGRPVSLDHDRIRALHAEGKGPTEISRIVGCTRRAIYKVVGPVGRTADKAEPSRA